MRIELNIIIHATDNPDKILNSLKRIVNYDVTDIKRTDLTGHHKNPITYYRIVLRGRERVMETLEKILISMSRSDVAYLYEYLDEHYHGNRLYIRIDKSSICRGGHIQLGDVDPVQLVISGVKVDRLRKMIDRLMGRP